MRSIVVAGHVCLDLSPQLPAVPRLAPGALVSVGALTVSVGGSVANTGSALAGLGARVLPSAAVGDDVLAGLLVSQLESAGFDVRGLRRERLSTTSYSLVLEAPGSDRTFWHHTGANDEFDGSEVEWGDSAVLHIGYPSLLPRLLEDGGSPLVALLARARGAGVTTSVDLAVVDPASAVGRLDWDGVLRRVAAETDVMSPSLDDLTSALGIHASYSPALVNRLAERLLADGVGLVAISAGVHGTLVRTADESRLRSGGRALETVAAQWADRTLVVPAVPVAAPVTTRGAGDASTAGLLYGLLVGCSLEDAATLAAATAASVVMGVHPGPACVTAIDARLAGLFGFSSPVRGQMDGQSSAAEVDHGDKGSGAVVA